jgi:UDP-glucuronate 4-epimerase
MLRFFTVYGPLGRPDMALFKFIKGIINKKKLIFITEAKCIGILLILITL